MYEQLKALIAGRERGLPMAGENEDGETVIVSVCGYEDGAPIYKTETAQHNGWMRINYYYPDGMVEELYDK